MIKIRKSHERGKNHIDWLVSFHTFSFANYYDPNFMNFSDLRVINEDTIAEAEGFETHAHRNMEIITYVVEGILQHKDSMGTGSLIRPGEIQIMSAGTGVEHSEFNHSQTEPLHLLQIWIIPEKLNLTPRYQQQKIPKKLNELILIGSRTGENEAVIIYQDVKLYMCYLTAENSVSYELQENRKAWLQLIKGEIELNNMRLNAGDGASLINEEKIEIKSVKDAEFLLFDLR